MAIGDMNFVTEIPAGVEGLVISLSANGDLDLQLFEGFQDELGLCLAGYGDDCATYSANLQTPAEFTHNVPALHDFLGVFKFFSTN